MYTTVKLHHDNQRPISTVSLHNMKFFNYNISFAVYMGALFNTFQQSGKVFIHSVCLSVRVLTLVNILQMSWNWCMLFISDIPWTVLKMIYIRLMVCLQRHTKVFRYITAYGGKCLKSILTYLDCTKYNEIDICHFDVQNNTSYKK